MEPPGQRKAIIEAHIAEIKINGSQLIPIFMIPAGNSDGSAETSTDQNFAHGAGFGPRGYGIRTLSPYRRSWSSVTRCRYV